MLTLSQATADSRKSLKYLAIFLAGLISLIIIVRGLFAIKELIAPTPPPPPTVSFGKLPKILFPQSVTQKNLEYSIDTVSGSLPTFPDRAYVNKTLGYTPNILDVDNATEKAASLNFLSRGIPLSDVNYRWYDNSNLQRQLTMDVVTDDFVLSSLFLSDPVVLSAKKLQDESAAIDTASSALRGMDEFFDDIDNSKATTTLFSIQNGALVNATSLSNAQVIGVNFFQSDVNKLPIFYPKGDSSTMTILVGSGDYVPQVVAADFSHQGVSSTSATYPIKTAQEAFDDLKNGKGYIAKYYQGDKISIKDVFLAYFLGEEKTKYLMPIVVFKGDGFYAYVSAVRDEWLEN